MKYHVINMAFAILLAISAGSCSKSETDGEDIPFSPIELTGQTRSIVSGGNSFGYRLLKEAVQQEDNSFMISPFSLTFALALTADSATEEEEFDQISKILGFEGARRSDIREYCSIMSERLPKLSEKVQVSTANAIVIDSDYGEPKAGFKDIATTCYNTMLESMPFKDNQEAVAKLINTWTKEETRGMIDKVIIPLNVLPGHEIIANALYFKGQWKYKFEKKNTARHTFTDEEGKKTQVDMMSMDHGQLSEIPYFENNIFQAVSLPYGNGAFEMTVYLPKSGYSLEDAADYLADKGKPKENGISVREISLPRFSIKGNTVNLTGILSKMGCEYLTELNGDSQENFLLVGRDIFQVSAIEVNESGTEAATVTIIGYTTGVSQDFCADHPFLYIISETSTGAVLFTGAYRGNE